MGPRPVFGLLGSTVLVAACANDFDSTRTPPPRGTLGEEMFGVLCDRVGAQALREDLTGASFTAVCHKDANGRYADAVDSSRLPPLVDGALDPSGVPVSLEEQKKTRAHAIARVETMGRRRFDLIAAIDAAIPDVKIAIKDLANADPAKSCGAPAAGGEGRLHEELANMLARFTALYDDGTIPRSTEALGHVMNVFKASPDAQAAYARFDARRGYRPLALALGAMRPTVAYPRMRDLANATLTLIADKGAARQEFSKVLEVTHEELRDAKGDPPVAPLPPPAVDASGRAVLARPRTSIEIAEQLLLAQNDAFGAGAPRYIASRDRRGYAVVPLVSGAVPAPFVDSDGDRLPDVDALGRFVTSDGSIPPSPFFAIGSTDVSRDAFGRALSPQGTPIYGTFDTTRTFAAKLLGDMKPLVDPSPAAKHETLMYALAGARVILGERDGAPLSTKQYSPNPALVDDWTLAHPGEPPPPNLGTTPVTVKYDGFRTETSSLLDFVYATSQLLADKSADDTLAFARAMVADHEADLARAVGDALFIKTQIADKHPEAQIPANSTLWDEMIDTVVAVAKEPGLLEDVLSAMANDDTLPLGTIFSSYLAYGDRISYDRANLNGPPYNFTTGNHSEMTTPVDRTKPQTGANRSAFYRFVQTIHDSNGVTVCNKDGAVVHARGVQLLGNADICAGPFATCGTLGSRPFKECEIFKIDNVSKFYLDAIIGKANLYFRPDVLRNGILGIGASTVDVIQQSSGITGFWDPPDSKTFRPKPEWLNRLVFFDQTNDSPNPGDVNYITNHFLRDLQGDRIGTTACPERVIDDPVPSAPDASQDGKVHGLRSCKDGDWFEQRDKDATFVWENFGFYKAIAPLASAFAAHKREDLFIALMEVLYKHWPEGGVSYEPLLSELFATDLLPALHNLTKILKTVTVKHCTASDPVTHACTATQDLDGIAVMAESTRAAVDPDRAKASGLKDRAGGVTAKRNDGTTNPQVTPIYLVLEALAAIDAQFATYAGAHASDGDRQAMWRAARSQLVDQFLDVDGQNTPNASFKNPALPKILPVVIDVLRAQLAARCPTSVAPPYATCAWARTDLTGTLETTMKGPAFATAVDLVDAIRKSDDARTHIEGLAAYLLDAASQNDALAAVLASAQDMVQAMKDDADMIPLLHVAAEAAAPSLLDDKGAIVRAGLVDAQIALLTRLNERVMDSSGVEICGKEIDPNQILPVLLANLVTPMAGPDGRPTQTPLEVIMDVVADVNRLDPGSNGALDGGDFANIADNVSDFLLNKERGMEQLYAIVRNGTIR